MIIKVYKHTTVDKITIAGFPNNTSIQYHDTTGIERSMLDSASFKHQVDFDPDSKLLFIASINLLLLHKDNTLEATVLSESTQATVKVGNETISSCTQGLLRRGNGRLNGLLSYINGRQIKVKKHQLCPHCGRLIDSSSVPCCIHCYEYHGVRKCEACSSVYICDNNIHPHNGEHECNVTDTSHNNSYCNRCVSECVECADCHIMMHPEHSEQHRGVRIVSIADSDGSDITVCSNCEHRRHTCNMCGARSTDLIPFPDGRSMRLCESCYDNQFNRRIMNYTYKPTPVFRGKGNVFFGVELEFNINNALPQDNVVKFFRDTIEYNGLPDEFDKMMYFKTDASIGYGLEFITHPFSPSFFNSHKSNFETIFKALQAAGGYAGVEYGADQCGIHVHMSKKSFTPLQIVKLFKFIYDNDDFTFTLSGRRDRDWFDRYCGTKDTEDGERYANKLNFNNIGKNKRTHHDRHSAIHMTDETIELRIFDSTLNLSKFTRTIETCEALFEWSKNVSRKEITVESFKKFVFSNRSKFPKLERYLRCV